MNPEKVLAFCEANPKTAIAIVNMAIESEADKDRVARLEVLREYLTNPEFKAKLADFVFATTYGA